VAFQMIFEEVQYRLPGLVTAPFCPPFLQRARGTSTDKMVRACGAKRRHLPPCPCCALGLDGMVRHAIYVYLLVARYYVVCSGRSTVGSVHHQRPGRRDDSCALCL